jgi:hypothetical protein
VPSRPAPTANRGVSKPRGSAYCPAILYRLNRGWALAEENVANSTKLVWSERPRAWRHESAPMNGDVQRLLLDIEEENDRLENELASPSLARMTEYAIARESGDPTLRRIGPIAERLHISTR